MVIWRKLSNKLSNKKQNNKKIMIWCAMKEIFLVLSLSKEINNWLFFMKKLNSQIPTLLKVRFITKINKNNSMDSDRILQIRGMNLWAFKSKSEALMSSELKLVSNKRISSIKKPKSKLLKTNLKTPWMFTDGENYKQLTRIIMKESSKFKLSKGTSFI